MSFELRKALPAALFSLALASAGCGHKASPFPPPAENPAQTTNLTVQQRGHTAVLKFAYPQLTVAGELLGPLTAIEVWRVTRPVSPPLGLEETTATETEGQQGTSSEAAEPDETHAADEGEAQEGEETPASQEEGEGEEDDDGELPEVSLEEQTAASAVEFNATAELVSTFDAEAIEAAVNGAELVFSVELAEAEHEELSHTFAIRSVVSGELGSPYSNLATLVQRRPPPEPTDFEVEGESDGIRISWALPELEEGGERSIEAVHLYRRSSESRIYGAPLTRLDVEILEYLDRSAAFGERYIYAVTSIGHERPLVESYFGGEREIDYADRFAPEPPTNLIALAEAGRVRLLWDASRDDDVVGYVIFRRRAGDEFRRLTDEPVPGVEYNDRSVMAGASYDYRISAVDGVGNQGEPSESVLARVP